MNDSHVLVVLVLRPSGFREDLHGHNNAFFIYSLMYNVVIEIQFYSVLLLKFVTGGG